MENVILSTKESVIVHIPTVYANYRLMGKDWEAKAQYLYDIKQSIKALEQTEEAVREELVALSDGKNARGGDFIFTLIPRKGAVEYSKVPELQGVDLEPYRKAIVDSWKLGKV